MSFKRSLISWPIFVFFLASVQLPAADKGQALLFPLKYNNVQPLPQKFEFSLRDAYRFLLGNRIIDTANFEFHIKPSPSAAPQALQVDMKWPDNLFEKGTLNILSPSGVAVWSTQLKEKQNLISFPNGTSLIEQLMALSFFKFCISQYELNTGMEVCSPEFVIKGSGTNLQVQTKPYPQKPSIQINGKTVTHHGIVFLNDEKESLSFRAMAASGAEFKMDTRSVNLEFMDVTNINNNLMAVTVKGPLPLAPSIYKVIKDDIWTVTLRKDRALVYILGAGKVPLRQEFVVQGTLPTEANRLYLEKSSPTKAYASSLDLYGWIPEKGIPQAADSSSDVSVSGNRFTWSLRNLTLGQNKTSYIKIADGTESFVANYSFSRAFANRLELAGGFNSFENNFYVTADAQMWLESLPILTRLSQQKVGLGLIYSQDLTGDTKTLLTELDLYWRLSKGLQLIDSSFYVGAGIQNWTFKSKGVQTLAPFAGWMGPAFEKLKYFDWQEMQLKQSLAGKSGDLEIKSRMELKWKLYQPFKDQTKLRYSIGYYNEDGTEKKSGALLEAAWVMIF